VNPDNAEGVESENATRTGALAAGIESPSERIAEYNEQIEQLAQQSYPQVALLKQAKGVGVLIALTFLLTLEDAQRFRKSRDVGCHVGLQPGRRNSGQSEPQMHEQGRRSVSAHALAQSEGHFLDSSALTVI
jgi:transposase